MKDIERLYPEAETYDEKESDRLDSIAVRKARGKGNPKKKRTAEGMFDFSLQMWIRTVGRRAIAKFCVFLCRIEEVFEEEAGCATEAGTYGVILERLVNADYDAGERKHWFLIIHVPVLELEVEFALHSDGVLRSIKGYRAPSFLSWVHHVPYRSITSHFTGLHVEGIRDEKSNLLLAFVLEHYLHMTCYVLR